MNIPFLPANGVALRLLYGVLYGVSQVACGEGSSRQNGRTTKCRQIQRSQRGVSVRNKKIASDQYSSTIFTRNTHGECLAE